MKQAIPLIYESIADYKKASGKDPSYAFMSPDFEELVRHEIHPEAEVCLVVCGLKVIVLPDKEKYFELGNHYIGPEVPRAN